MMGAHQPHHMLKYITAATAIAALVGFVAGTAYGAKTPVVRDLAAKFPGSKVAV